MSFIKIKIDEEGAELKELLRMKAVLVGGSYVAFYLKPEGLDDFIKDVTDKKVIVIGDHILITNNIVSIEINYQTNSLKKGAEFQ